MQTFVEEKLIPERDLHEDVMQNDDDDEEFSFASPLISADQIKPVFPVFNQQLLFEQMTLHEDGSSSSSSSLPVKKIFVQTEEKEPRQKKRGEDRATSSSESDVISGPSSRKVACKKSNSTGFSKIWRLKDLVGSIRSHSDGRDAFVSLSEPHKKLNERKKKMASYSAHEAYLRSKVKEDKKMRSSYLPYRPQLLGFFTNLNAGLLTKNVHPF